MLQSAQEFNQWLRTAKSGDQIVYHVGFLMADRVPRLSDTIPAREQAERVNQIGNAAWKAAGMYRDKNFPNKWQRNGDARVNLTQRRVAEGACEYIATVV